MAGEAAASHSAPSPWSFANLGRVVRTRQPARATQSSTAAVSELAESVRNKEEVQKFRRSAFGLTFSYRLSSSAVLVTAIYFRCPQHLLEVYEV